MVDKNEQLKQINVEVENFLKKLKYYRESVNLIDSNTVDLLDTLVDNISSLFDTAKFIEIPVSEEGYVKLADSIIINNSGNLKATKASTIGLCRSSSPVHHTSFQSVPNILKSSTQPTFSIPSANAVIGFQEDPPIVSPEPSDKSEHLYTLQSCNESLDSKSDTSEPKIERKRITGVILGKVLQEFLIHPNLLVEKFTKDSIKIYNINTKPIEQNLRAKFFRKYPSFSVTYFGTRVMLLAESVDKLNINISLGLQKKINCSKFLEDELLPFLKKDTSNWSNLSKRKAPLLSIGATFHTLNIPCEITIYCETEVCNTKLINYLFDLQPICRKICVYLKLWSQRCRLETAFTNSKMLPYLVLFYFQTENLLPSIYTLQPKLQPGKPFQSWQTDFNRLSSKDLNISISKKYDKNILEFFKFYANFNFDKNAICPVEGKILNRTFYSKSSLPKSMTNLRLYESSLNGKEYELKYTIYNSSAVMILQDPCELDYNLAWKMDNVSLLKFRNFCYETYIFLIEKQ